MDLSEDARALVVDVVAGLDAELYDVELDGGALRVTLDRPGGIGLDDLATASRTLSRALDEADPVPGSYTLEVSSPGLERNLRTIEHWRRAVGDRVRVKTVAGSAGDRRVDGVVDEVRTDEVAIRTDDGEVRTVGLAEVERARTVFEWGGAPKPSARGTR